MRDDFAPKCHGVSQRGNASIFKLRQCAIHVASFAWPSRILMGVIDCHHAVTIMGYLREATCICATPSIIAWLCRQLPEVSRSLIVSALEPQQRGGHFWSGLCNSSLYILLSPVFFHLDHSIALARWAAIQWIKQNSINLNHDAWRVFERSLNSKGHCHVM